MTMTLLPCKGIPGTAFLIDGDFTLWEVDILSKGHPENGAFQRIVWAESSRVARARMVAIFGDTQFTFSTEKAKVHINVLRYTSTPY